MPESYQTDLLPYLVQGDEIEILLVELEDKDALKKIVELTGEGKVSWTWWNECRTWNGSGHVGDVEVRMTRDIAGSGHSIDALFEKYAYYRIWEPYFQMKGKKLDMFVINGIYTTRNHSLYRVAESLYDNVMEVGELLR